MNQIVTADYDDSVQIRRLDGTVLQIPAKFIVSVDFVMRFLLRESERGGDSFGISEVEDGDTGECGWEAYTDEAYSELMLTPWAALLSLAENLKEAHP